MSAAALRARVRRGPRSVKQGSPLTRLRLRTLPLPFCHEPDILLSPPAEPAPPQPASVQPGPVQPGPVQRWPAQSSQPTLPEAQAAIAAEPATRAISGSSGSSAQQALMARLTREVQRIEVSGRTRTNVAEAAPALFSTGCGEMDRCLPNGGYASGTVVEYLQASSASGATSLALTAAREALTATDRFCVFVDWCQQFYPPAAAALGIDLKRVVIVRPRTLADRLWAIDQALRSPAVAAVIAEIEHMDDRAARRLQLAAERGGGVGLLVRRASAQSHPSWAEVQWLVRPLADSSAHRQLKLELTRVRGGRSGTSVRVQINALHGRVEPIPASTAVLARSLSQPRTHFESRQERSA